MTWHEIRRELIRRQENHEPVETVVYGVRNWIDEVGDDYVILHSERTGNPRTITSRAIAACTAPNRRIKLALQQLGDC